MSSDIGNRRSRIETQGAFRFRLLRWAARRSTQPGGFVEGSDLVNNELTHDERAGPPASDFDSAPSERLARRLLHALAERNAGLGLLYSVLDVAVSELGLTRAAVVMDEPPFARQLFRAGRRVEYDDGFLATQAPGLYAEPALDPGSDIAEMVTDACRLALRGDRVAPRTVVSEVEDAHHVGSRRSEHALGCAASDSAGRRAGRVVQLPARVHAARRRVRRDGDHFVRRRGREPVHVVVAERDDGARLRYAAEQRRVVAAARRRGDDVHVEPIGSGFVVRQVEDTKRVRTRRRKRARVLRALQCANRIPVGGVELPARLERTRGVGHGDAHDLARFRSDEAVHVAVDDRGQRACLVRTARQSRPWATRRRRRQHLHLHGVATGLVVRLVEHADRVRAARWQRAGCCLAASVGADDVAGTVKHGVVPLLTG